MVRKKEKKKKIIVVIAAYNEEEHIKRVVEKVIEQGYEVIVVDDGSTDKTGEEAEKAGAIVLKHIINTGKGAAMKTGCDYALKEKADVIVLMDGDEQHKAEDIPRFIKALEKAEVVLGYRKINKNMPLIMRIGNKIINTASSIINGIKIKDTQSGFRAMTSEAYKKIRWRSPDYGMESEMIAKIAKKKIKYKQIPISTIYHDKFKGTTVFDGIKIVLRIIKWKI